MKYSKIINIYEATEALADKTFTNEQQWQIYKFRKLLREHKEFYEGRQKIINDKYTKFTDENGILRGEKYQEYLKEQNDLDNTEVDISYDRFTLPIVDGINFKIMEPLEDFIEFTITS